jgi:fucose 4-O-acetylase-like acetyltransferase
MERNYKLDNIRALAILSVVFGHSIILYSSSWGLYETYQTSAFLDYVKRFINLYQMPLFFALSGYLLSGSCRKNFGTFVCSKALRLLIPFLSIGVLFMIPLKMCLGYSGYSGDSFASAIMNLLLGRESGHLWYLPTLFYIFCLSYPIAKLSDKHPLFALVALVLAISLNIVGKLIPTFGIPYIRNVYEYLWSFLLGLVIQRYSLENMLRKPRYIIAACTLIVTVGAVILSRSSIAVSALITVATFLLTPNQENKVFASLSTNSFGIYLIHSPLVYITFTYLLNAKPIVVVFVNFIIWGSVSYSLSRLIRKSRFKFILGA